MRPTTPVKVETVPQPGGGTEIKKTHPAFVMVGFHRISGGKSRLFGSEIETPHVIRLRVARAEESWHLSEKWWHASTSPIIEVDMTPAQFAEAITCMNIGDGVPGTLRELRVHKSHEPYLQSMIPDFKDDDTVTSMVIDDVKADVTSIVRRVDKLVDEVGATLDEARVSGKKRESIVQALEFLKRKLHDDMPFILEQYRGAIETMQSHAKAEMDAYVTHHITQLGLKSLAQLTEGDKDQA